MGIESILTFIGVGAIVVVLALYLITVATMLRHVSFTVGTILIGVRSIATQTEPLADVLGSIAKDVTDIEAALGGLVASGSLTEGDYRANRHRMLPAGRSS